MKMMYTRPEDGGLSVVIGVPKEAVERVLGPLTQEEYEQHVRETSIPEGALNVKVITDADIPADREFREAWIDATADTKINIDMRKAKEIKLVQLREKRNKLLDAADKETLMALEKGQDLAAIKAKKQALRDATNPLKALKAEGVDNEELLDQIKALSILEE
jgi:hypothetical protein